jgi:hypothetical protein
MNYFLTYDQYHTRVYREKYEGSLESVLNLIAEEVYDNRYYPIQLEDENGNILFSEEELDKKIWGK